MPAIPAGLEDFYTQELTWEDCGKLKCAELTVPMDYANPNGETITVALAKHSARGKAIGSLLVNPGGPGSSGKEMAENAATYFSPALRNNFDIIGFDPRGVGDSTPVSCLPAAELIPLLEASYPDTPAGEAESEADIRRLAAGCAANAGAELSYVGTAYVARDMDVMRHVLGDPQLYYLGFSYGTQLGDAYAKLFPQNVGRMVLDGVVDVDVSSFEQSLAQSKGFEAAFDAYLTDCLAGTNCPFTGTVAQAREQVIDLMDRVLESPIPTSKPDRPLTQTALLYGIITPLYDNTTWPILSLAFNQVFTENDGSTFQFIFDTYMSIGLDGEFTSNMIQANWAVNCADVPAVGDNATWREQADQLAKESPIFGKVMGYSEYLCQVWPISPDREFVPSQVNASAETAGGAASEVAPIVVIGTTGDPATPYQWSQEFAKKLESSVLLTWEGEGHTAYVRAGDCIRRPVDDYLINGKVPQGGLVCPNTAAY